MLTPPSVESQLAVATAGRPVSSLRRETLVVMVRSLMARSKEPLSFLFRTRRVIYYVEERIFK